MKNKKIKVILGTIGFLFLALFSVQNVYAASGYAFSMGTNFGTNNIDTSKDANYVNSLLKNMGYTAYKTVVPTSSVIDGTFSSGRKRLESDILFLAGHANSSTMYWNYLSKGKDYAQALRNNEFGICDSNWNYTGIGRYNMSNVDFAFFAGCETAKGSGNITEYAKNRGAKTTLGWTVSVNDADAYAWEQKFFTKLKSGATISSAVNYANGFTYTTTTVKNTKLYGNTGAKINNVYELETMSIKNNDISEIYINEKLSDKTISENQISNIIASKVNKQFDAADFIVESAVNDDGIIYDYYLKINNIKTNIGYTVFTSNNVVTKIVDNMKNNEINSLKLAVNSKLSVKKIVDKELLKSKALEKVDYNYSTDVLEIYDDFMIYDVETGKTYYIVLVKATDPIFNTHSIISHKFEI